MLAAFCFLLHAMACAVRHVYLLKVLHFTWLSTSSVKTSHVSDRVMAWGVGNYVLHPYRPIGIRKPSHHRLESV